MVSYRGVAQQEIINSIIDACELVQQNSPGPKCDEKIDAILDSIPQLQRAASDEAFRSALHSSNVSIFLRMRELFDVYAARNTGGVGRQVLQNLQAWGALDGAITLQLTPMDQEINVYCFVQNVRRINDVDYRALRKVIENSSFVTDEKEIRTAFRNLQSLLHSVQAGASDDDLKAAYADMHVGRGDGRLVRFAIEHLSHDASLDAASTPVFDIYGVVLKDMVKGAKFHIVQQNNEELIKAVNVFLLPFYETDEVQMTAIGMITRHDPKAPGGITFVVTARVAQAVADAFPDQTVVRGSDNTVIAPSVKAPAAKKDPKP